MSRRRAADVRAAEQRQERLVARRAALEQEVDRLKAEIVELERSASEVTARLERSARVSSVEPPEPGLSGLAEWGARAHAALVVARGGLEAERERIVREANELASSVLGEPLYTARVAQVRKRLEEALAQG